MEQERAAVRRRTQDERRRTTRARLLSATIECLGELGYRGTTTLEIERRAAVSRGARIHYFPTKQDLLAAAVDSLYSQLAAHYDAALSGLAGEASDGESVSRALGVIWSIYRRPEYTAVLELSIAARTDEELRARLLDVRVRQHDLAVAAVGRYLPSLSAPTIDTLIETLNASMLGMLVQRGLHEGHLCEEAILNHLGSLVTHHLRAAAHASA